MGESAVHDWPGIMAEILRGYVLPSDGAHGVVHWARVWENGHRLARVTGADQEIVGLFALFHDARRVNEQRDDGHGERGAELARAMRQTWLDLGDDQFDLLIEACRYHTDGLTAGHSTVLTCWDADRLDLGRVGIEPRAHRLCTEAGRDLLRWAHGRATRQDVPTRVLRMWGIE